MGKVFDEIDDRLIGWIAAQQLFFVATAPSGDGGHVNCSPKGPIESLRVLGPRRVAYLDLVGSGAETIAHLRQNGRIVIMLCAFVGPPRILRHLAPDHLLHAEPGHDQQHRAERHAEDEVAELLLAECPRDDHEEDQRGHLADGLAARPCKRPVRDPSRGPGPIAVNGHRERHPSGRETGAEAGTVTA